MLQNIILSVYNLHYLQVDKTNQIQHETTVDSGRHVKRQICNGSKNLGTDFFARSEQP